MRLRRPATTAVTAFALAGVLAACGGDSDSQTAEGSGASGAEFVPAEVEGVPALEVDPELAEMVPEEIREEGSVTVATNAPFPPYEMFASEADQTLIGLEPDLGHAVGNLLGLEFDFVQQPFDGLIPGLQAGRYPVIMATFFDTAEREQVVDMVNYSASGSGILVAAGNPEGISTAEDLCGRTVAVQTGSAQVDLVNGFSEQCGDAGPIEVRSLPQYSDELLALSTGQAQAVVGDIPAISYSLEEEANVDRFELVLDPAFPNGYESAPVGVAVSKDSGLTDPIAGALQELMDNGAYEALLEKWGVERIAVDEVTVNAASGGGSS